MADKRKAFPPEFGSSPNLEISHASTLARAVGDTAPLASVIVVCWNSCDVIGRCLDQLLAQDYPNYEIVLVDDASEDNTLAIAERARAQGEITIVRSRVNRGCSHARNIGLRHAKGEVIAFIDADGFAAPSWLRQIVDALGAEETNGGAASTVCFERNPLVINGAGGTVNRQGWAADLSMNESYEHAKLVPEALYAMGCGMAMRRSAIERVGPFDDRMLNYYDDVDYGIRMWRAGYRVVVAPDALIDHEYGRAGDDTPRKRLLCERHRMRVVLKHAPATSLVHWAAHESIAFKHASWPRRILKLRAFAWNALHLPSTLRSRLRLRRAAPMPNRLVDQSWGEAFPAGVPPITTPSPEAASESVDMADPGSARQLLYGWFPPERIGGRSCRWSAGEAAVLVSLPEPARKLRLQYAHAPIDTGGVNVRIRQLGSADPLASVWSTRLNWQYLERAIENHPLDLRPGEYEVSFSAPAPWSDPPRETRQLGFALIAMSLESSYELVSGGVDMASPAIEDQLLYGWFEAERDDGRSFRWAGAHAAAIVRLAESIEGATLSYRMTPGQTGGVALSVRPVESSSVARSDRITWHAGGWSETKLPIRLGPGDYVVSFDAEATWSNPGGRDPACPPENRTLGFALSSLMFTPQRER